MHRSTSIWVFVMRRLRLRFLADTVVVNDEDNVLRVYRFGEPSVVQAFSLDQFLKPI